MNGNIGTIATRTNIWSANYGVTDRLNVIAMVPYVWTRASQGVLHGLQGFQDVTLAAKYQFLARPSSNAAGVRAFAVVAAGIPLASYNPELPPLSIGTSSKSVSARGTVQVQSDPGWFVAGSTAYMWRSDVELDRPDHFTDDQFVMSNMVDMPNALDYMVSAGYMKRGSMSAVSVSQHRTLGGGDIRRQDMPFVSNRMNFSRVGAMGMYPVPKLTHLQVQLVYGYTFDGRNVGQASTITGGFLYRFHGRPVR